jgi:hypothetical protein
VDGQIGVNIISTTLAPSEVPSNAPETGISSDQSKTLARLGRQAHDWYKHNKVPF